MRNGLLEAPPAAKRADSSNVVALALHDVVAAGYVPALVLHSPSGGWLGPAGRSKLTTATAPIVTLPPRAARLGHLERVLVPIQDTAATVAAHRPVVGFLRRYARELVVASVADLAELPPFEDAIGHEMEAWTGEFVARLLPGRRNRLRVVRRVGVPADKLLEIAEHEHPDLVAVVWSQRLDEGRAAVVKRLLTAWPRPILLVPASLVPTDATRPSTRSTGVQEVDVTRRR